MQRRTRRYLSRAVTALSAGLALLIVYSLYAGGFVAIAAAVAATIALAFYVYHSRRTYGARYLFPGLLGIGLFAVMPLIYTVWISFTNYSSTNLLSFERATEVLLSDSYQDDDARYQFTLHPAPGGFRIVLRTGEEPAPASEEPSMFDNGAGAAPVDAGPDAAAATPPATAPTDPNAPNAPNAPAVPAAPAAPAPAAPPAPTAFVTPVLPLTAVAPATVTAVPLTGSGFTEGEPAAIREVVARGDALKALTVAFPDGTTARMASLQEFIPSHPLYHRSADGTLVNQKTKAVLTPNFKSGFYEAADGSRVIPGFRATLGLDNYVRVATDPKFRGPFFRIFVWTVVFALLTVVLTASLGMVLAELLSWEGLRFAGFYRVLLFLPYAVPGFISILVFKGLFNNLGAINTILDGLFGIRPNWLGNAMLARITILVVNTWLGYPYFMLLCMGLQKSIPRDLYEASALAGAGPITNFFQITWPLIRKPLTPLLVSSFAFNFNNFVLIYLLTQGRPDFLDTAAPAGETDILVSYTYRIAFEDAGQNFGLAAAISTIIFAMVAVLSVINLRLTKANDADKR